ncbi:MAG: DUF2695 domain-containing protein [Planctomycetota bacterium]
MVKEDEKRRRQEIKRQLREKELAELLALLPFAIQELRPLIAMLEREHEERSEQFDETSRLTHAWLEERGHDPAACEAFFEKVGGFCDFEIMANVPSNFLLADFFE